MTSPVGVNDGSPKGGVSAPGLQIPRISVAMCTFNGSRYVADQLEAIAAQTVPPAELVVCDDRSEDDTVALAEAFQARAAFPVSIYVNEERLSTTKNFERAISRCDGAVIVLADQDDVWKRTKLERLREAFVDPGVGAVLTDAEVVDEQLRPLGFTLWKTLGFGRRERERAAQGGLVEILLQRNVGAGATLAFRAAWRDLVLPIPPLWVHDGWILFLIAAVAPVSIVDECLTLYRQHPDQQIGGVRRPAVTPAELVGATRERWSEPVRYRAEGLENCVAALQRFSLVYDRLEEKGNLSSDSDVRTRLREKISHFRARVDLPERRRDRIPVVVRELVHGRYQRYSRGVFSAAKDLAR